MFNSNEFTNIKKNSNDFKTRRLFQDVVITPRLASELLGLNTNNRPLKKNLVTKYANEMINNCWQFTGESISIDSAGKMNNGQHRLHGIIESQTTQVMNIQCGLDPLTFNVLDTGAARLGSDALAIKGYTQSKNVALIIRFLNAYYNGHIEKYLTKPTSKMSNQQICDYTEMLDTVLLQKAATEMAVMTAKYRFLDNSSTAPLFYLFSIIDPEKTQLFFNKLADGNGIGLDSYAPIYLLRNKLIEARTSGNRINTINKWALTIKAWNFFLKEQPIKLLRWGLSEDFPIISQETTVKH